MNHKPNGTQQQRILRVLENLQDGKLNAPAQFIRQHPDGNGISARYFKQVTLISEVNGRISELRGKGYDIETSKERDPYGFVYHRLKPEHPNFLQKQLEWFDAL